MPGAPERAESLRPVPIGPSPQPAPLRPDTAAFLDDLGIEPGAPLAAAVLDRLAGMVRDAERQRSRREAVERDAEFARQHHEMEVERLMRRCEELSVLEVAQVERSRLAALENEKALRHQEQALHREQREAVEREAAAAAAREAEVVRLHEVRFAEAEVHRQRSEVALADLDTRFHAEMHRLHLAVDRHAKEAILARAQAGAVAEQLHAVLTSASWRAASPIRFAARLARRGLRFARRRLRRSP